MISNLKKNLGEGVQQLEYFRIIGSLMYLMNCTRANIANSINRLSGYTSIPKEEHWRAIIRVLRYLMYMTDYGLHHMRYPAILESFSNANWISDSNITKSTSGYILEIGGAVVSWKSSK